MNNSRKIKFYVTSYSEEITASCNHVNILWPDGRDVAFIIDCGLFQEKQHNKRNLQQFGFSPSNISFAIATHVHTDHVGRFPFLVKMGFPGRIYTTEETYELLPVILEETCARLQEEFEIALKKYKHQKKDIPKKSRDSKGHGRKDKPRREHGKCKQKDYNKSKYKDENNRPFLMFDEKDVEITLQKVTTVSTFEPFSPIDGLEITFYPNAHIGGAVCVGIKIFDETEEINLLFTGDLGMTNPVTGGVTYIPDEVCEKIDFIVSEATYGTSTEARPTESEREKHIKILQDVHKKKGTVMYMSNALERPQKVCADLKAMQQENVFDGIKDFDIFLDSTFGIKCHMKYAKLYGTDYLPAKFEITDKTDRQITMSLPGPKMIICTSPRFYQGSFVTYGSRMLKDKNVVLIFVAYIPENVRNIINLPRGTEIDFFGEKVKLMCKMYDFSYYSSHVSTEELDSFLAKFTNVKAILFNHGTDEAKCNYVARYKNDKNSTHNLLYGKAVMLTKDGIVRYL